MNRGGLCEACIAPGFCCREINLFGANGEFSVWDGDDPVEELRARGFRPGDSMPFVPLRKVWTGTAPEGHDAAGRTYSAYHWGCTALDDATGRCTIYEDRPQLCRDFKPGSGPLCVHFVAPSDEKKPEDLLR